MKTDIAIFSNHLFSYSETFIMSQAESLRSYAPTYVGSDLVHNGICPPNEKTVLVNSGGVFGKVKDSLLKMGLPLPSTVYDLKKKNIKLIHAHFGPNGYTSISLSHKLNIPLVVTFHGFDLIDKPTKKNNGRLHINYFNNIEKLSSEGSLFIAVSDFIKNKLITFGFSEDKIRRCYIGIDTDKFSPDNNIKREKIILCVGRMSKYKGQEYLIEAMEDILKKNPEYKLVLVGDGEEKNNLENLAKLKNLNVLFTGKQSPEEVINWMRKAKVYVQPSVRLDNGQEEALALTIAEAQSVGTPAVVFRSGGMPEAIAPEFSGFAVTEKNCKELSDAINLLINDEELWSRFSKHSRQHILENHNLSKQCIELEHIYDEVLNNITNS